MYGFSGRLYNQVMDKKIKVAIVDDHPGVRAGIKRLLISAGDIVIVGEGTDGTEAIQLVRAKDPDVLLLDVEMPTLRGDDALQEILTQDPDVKVLAVSSYHDRLYIQGMLDNGAAGYITKDEAPALLLQAIRSVVGGTAQWVSPKAHSQAWQTNGDELTLTSREVEILHALVEGQSTQQISGSLGLELSQVERYIHLLQYKYSVDSLDELIQAAKGKLPPMG